MLYSKKWNVSFFWNESWNKFLGGFVMADKNYEKTAKEILEAVGGKKML